MAALARMGRLSELKQTQEGTPNPLTTLSTGRQKSPYQLLGKPLGKHPKPFVMVKHSETLNH